MLFFCLKTLFKNQPTNQKKNPNKNLQRSVCQTNTSENILSLFGKILIGCYKIWIHHCVFFPVSSLQVACLRTLLLELIQQKVLSDSRKYSFLKISDKNDRPQQNKEKGTCKYRNYSRLMICDVAFRWGLVLFVVTPVFPTPNNILNYNLLRKKGGGFVRDLQFLAASTQEQY